MKLDYLMSDVNDMVANTDVSFMFMTSAPDTYLNIHRVATSAGDIQFEMYESVTGVTLTGLTPEKNGVCLKRNVANTHVMDIYRNVTYVPVPTERIIHDIAGVGADAKDDDIHFKLKADTQYIFRITNGVSATSVSSKIMWSEEVQNVELG